MPLWPSVSMHLHAGWGTNANPRSKEGRERGRISLNWRKSVTVVEWKSGKRRGREADVENTREDVENWKWRVAVPNIRIGCRQMLRWGQLLHLRFALLCFSSQLFESAEQVHASLYIVQSARRCPLVVLWWHWSLSSMYLQLSDGYRRNWPARVPVIRVIVREIYLISPLR